MKIKIKPGSDVKRIEKVMDEMPGYIESGNKSLAYDLKRRIPPQVKKGVKSKYAVDESGYKTASISAREKKTSSGSYDIAIEYSGRVLSLEHFHQKRKGSRKLSRKATLAPGQAFNGSDVIQVHQPRPYRVAATIIKGHVSIMPGHAFIAKEGHAFRRPGDTRLPIESIRTLSVPQMITGRARPEIEKRMSETIAKRQEHQLARIEKKLMR